MINIIQILTLIIVVLGVPFIIYYSYKTIKYTGDIEAEENRDKKENERR